MTTPISYSPVGVDVNDRLPPAALARIRSDLASVPKVRNPGKLARARTALAKALFVQQHVVVVGDSIIDGGNANDAPINTDADKTIARQRSVVAQLQRLFAARLGIDTGEGFVWMGGGTAGTSIDARWTYATNANPTLAVGAYGQGRRLAPGNIATALGQEFATLDVLGWSGGASAHLPRVKIDDTQARPTALAADALAGVVAAGKWTARGSGSTVAQAGSGQITLTRTGSAGAVVADYLTKFSVVAGQTFACTCAVLNPGTARGYAVALTFYDNTDAIIGTETRAWSSRSIGGGTLGQGTGFITAPAGAVTAMVSLRGDSYSVDQAVTFSEIDVIPVKTVSNPTSGVFWQYQSTVALGSHKVEIVPGVADNTDVSGTVMRKRTDAGVVIHRIGRPGSHSSDAVYAGGTVQQVDQRLAALTKLLGTLGPVPLVIVALGTNDFGDQSPTPTEYRANLKALTDYQAALGGCSLLVAGSRFSSDAGKTYGEELYYAQQRDLSDTDPYVASIDLKDSWGTDAQATALGFKASGLGIHPTLAGHGDYARIIFDALTNQIITPAS